MTDFHSFGSENRYYADASSPVVRPSLGSQTPYQAAFEHVARSLEEAVGRVVRDFDVLAREALRAETGLKLNFQ